MEYNVNQRGSGKACEHIYCIWNMEVILKIRHAVCQIAYEQQVHIMIVFLIRNLPAEHFPKKPALV